jgi:hypothetical protein
MHTFAQKQNQPQKRASAGLARSNTVTPAPNHREHPILHLQRAIETDLTGAASPRFGHDFSRIPIHPPAAGALQTKAAIEKPGEEYKQEADSISEEVMRIPEPRLQPACACGGGCPRCQSEKATHEHVQTDRLQPNDTGKMVAPPIVHAVLHSSGQPLTPAAREFMEARFGYDFSRVRVHSNDEAANAARAVQARAYTSGHHIVFGAGQYQPLTSEGKLLLAHELTHVVQQDGGATEVAYRRPDESPPNSSAAPRGGSGATERLLAIIADIQRVQANVSRSPGDARTDQGSKSESQEYAEKLTGFIEQLRAVAKGNDEKLKMSVLAAFSSEGIQKAEARKAEEDSKVREQRSESLAAKSLEVSHPRDAAEIEADRIAQAVVHGPHATVTQTAPRGLVSRQGMAEALAGAGGLILTTEAESLPFTSWNPPGWVALGVATVVAAALLGTAVYMASNVADTGIMEEVQQLITAAAAAGAALTICAALAQLMAAAKRAGDSKRVLRIKATEKAKGCRHSSFS